jgi:hypothetical protein
VSETIALLGTIGKKLTDGFAVNTKFLGNLSLAVWETTKEEVVTA